MRGISVFYGDNGKGNGNYYNGLYRFRGSGFRVEGFSVLFSGLRLRVSGFQGPGRLYIYIYVWALRMDYTRPFSDQKCKTLNHKP